MGFPVQLISKLCCTIDGAGLELQDGDQSNEDSGLIRNGKLLCGTCEAAFAISDGILNMLNESSLADESRHEMKIRNEIAAGSSKVNEPDRLENEHDLMEMVPTLEALSLDQEKTILELGCGDGRYTVPLAGRCRRLLAVDFSIESLLILKQRLQGVRNVGLVLGDITTMKFTAGFDRVLSTLVSNLPTGEHRNAMYRLAANALKPNGRFVFSTHHHGFRQMLFGEMKSGRYNQGGIYRYSFAVSECRKEILPYFKSIDVRPIQIYFPFARSLRLPLLTLSRLLESVPLINRLGELILCTAEQRV